MPLYLRLLILWIILWSIPFLRSLNKDLYIKVTNLLNDYSKSEFGRGRFYMPRLTFLPYTKYNK